MRGNVRSAARTLSFALPLIVMIAALGLGVGAASGSSKKLNCGLGNGKKATGKAINVGAVVQASGGIDFSSASKGSAAFFACVNANGGINGRRVNFLVEDGGSDPAKTGAAAAKLVDDEKVVALVGSTSLLDCGVNGNFYNKRRVLVIAGVGAPRECFNTRNIAPVNTGPRLGAVASAQWAHEKYGAKKFVVLVYGLPSIGDWVSDGVSQYAKTIGGSSTKILFAPGVPDPQSIVLQASALNPDAIILVPAVQDTVALLKAADAQGLRDKYRWVCLTPCYDESFPAAAGPAWKGLEIHSEFTVLDAKTPDNTLWHTVMDKYAATSARRDSFSQAGFLAAKIFTDTLLKMDPKAINRASVTKAVRAIHGYRTDLSCGPYYFGPLSIHDSNHAARVVADTGTGFKFVGKCFEIKDPELAPILKAETKLHLTK